MIYKQIIKLWGCNKPIQEIPVVCVLWYFYRSFMTTYSTINIDFGIKHSTGILRLNCKLFFVQLASLEVRETFSLF